MIVYVQNLRGDIVWRYTYDDRNEMLRDLAVLSKPSLYGGGGFRIVIQGDL